MLVDSLRAYWPFNFFLKENSTVQQAKLLNYGHVKVTSPTYIGVKKCLPAQLKIWLLKIIPLMKTMRDKGYSYFRSKQKGINQWHICACILNFKIYL